jgi:hypothetical protein
VETDDTLRSAGQPAPPERQVQPPIPRIADDVSQAVRHEDPSRPVEAGLARVDAVPQGVEHRPVVAERRVEPAVALIARKREVDSAVADCDDLPVGLEQDVDRARLVEVGDDPAIRAEARVESPRGKIPGKPESDPVAQVDV